METIVSGHCNRCGKVWTLEKGQGVCQWCGKPTTCQSSTTKPRSIKSSLKHRQRQVDGNGNGNGYDQLDGKWLTYYNVASKYSHKAQAQDREDLLHTIISTLADSNHNRPLTIGGMYRVASIELVHYWRSLYSQNNGLDCGSCSQKQRHHCRKHDSYRDCPKAVKLESLYKPITDSDGNITELGELIADDTAIDLDQWLDYKTFLAGMPKRLLTIAIKRRDGLALDAKDRQYLSQFRKKEQISFF